MYAITLNRSVPAFSSTRQRVTKTSLGESDTRNSCILGYVLTRQSDLSTALAFVLAAAVQPEYLEKADITLDELLSDPNLIVRHPHRLDYARDDDSRDT